MNFTISWTPAWRLVLHDIATPLHFSRTAMYIFLSWYYCVLRCSILSIFFGMPKLRGRGLVHPMLLLFLPFFVGLNDVLHYCVANNLGKKYFVLNLHPKKIIEDSLHIKMDTNKNSISEYWTSLCDIFWNLYCHIN